MFSFKKYTQGDAGVSGPRGLDSEDEAFVTKFSELTDDVQHHVEEESAMFPEAEQILADQLEDLIDEMVALKAQGTTLER